MALKFGSRVGRVVALVMLMGSSQAALYNQGTIEAVYGLMDRTLPGARSHFELGFVEPAQNNGPAQFSVADASGNKIGITGSSASELSAGVGWYLRERCNMTIGWPRGGGSNLFIPKVWPQVGTTVTIQRNTPYSYIMNVCTHSYSLVWYSWNDWEVFLDWMALSGINLYLAMTGQEEVQYKVFRKYGLTDSEIRAWFNGPAFLTWSRGQNEYGNGIAGPLPRSWMKQQWEMQQLIVARHRSLGMYGQLPGFQGNVPVGLKQVQGDGNITSAAATGWMNSVDPLYGKIADTWMEEMIADFGTDSWYQLDGYFNGGTAPWYVRAPVDCVWSTEASDTYLPGCDEQCKSVQDLAQAKQACAADLGCGGITAKGSTGPWQLRSGSSGQHSSTGEVSWSITNTLECHPLRDDGSWFQRGAAAYQGLNRTDPQAIWSFQGWAFVGWNSREQAVSLKSFIDATPPGKFNVIDMSVNGDGEWKKWDNSSFWGANFVWTTLHDFGGTDGLKGRLDRINQIPFDAQDLGATVWGTGFTPEGIDQNPVYYEFMLEANWRTEPVADIEQHIVDRAHRRYGLTVVSEQVTTAWKLLVSSAYSQDLSVQDGTGVAHLGAAESWAFEPDRRTPSATMCQIYNAWLQLIEVADSGQVSLELETFRYDLINTGREVLAQLAGPFGQNFSDVTQSLKIDANLVSKLGELYSKVLIDLDTLVGTDKAFLLGPWLEAAKLFATDPKATDCIDTGYETIVDCARFYEWNARVQLTTWNPTPKLADKIPGGPIDYAAKHWSGLIKDYYATRVNLLTQQAIKDSGKTLNTTSWDRIQAGLAYNWTTDTKAYPTQPVGDPLQISKQIKLTYANFFTTC